MQSQRIDPEVFLKQHDLVYEAAPLEWGQGFLLGNGDMGVVLWGDGGPLKLTPDKIDVWELRRNARVEPNCNYQTLKRVVEERRTDEYLKYFDWLVDLNGPYPAHLRMGRICLDVGSEPTGFEGRLGLYDGTGTGTITYRDGSMDFRGLVHAENNVLVLEMDLEGDLDVTVCPELECRPQQLVLLEEENAEIIKRWGYPQAETGSEGGFEWHVQNIPDNGGYCVMWSIEKDTTGRHVTLLLTVTFCRDGDQQSAARKQLEDAIESGPAKLHDQHRAWWRRFWGKSVMVIPDSRLENFYYAEMYKLGSCATGKLPPAAHGVWTSDGSFIIPNMMDYHCNLNIQETYWPVYTSNHLELGEPLYDMLFEMLPQFCRFCRDFYGWDGAMAQTALAHDGPLPFGGYWTGSGPWLAQHFWLHYLYSRDELFLRERAYPFMREFMKLYVGLLEKGEDGLYHLPWDKSPEWNSDGVNSYGWDSTCSLGLVRFLAEALLDCQDILDINDPDAATWREILEHLTPYAQDETGLCIWRDTPLSHSHRHHSHLLPIYPLGSLNVEGSEADRDLIERSLNTWVRRGFGEWIGEDWTHASLIASRVGKGNMAWKLLQLYMDACITENTLNMNRDLKEYGLGSALPVEYSSSTWEKDFSVNGGFAGAAAVLEMLLQSWNGIIRVFPAVPHLWRDAYFRDLRAEGAFLVTSRLADGKVTFIDIVSEVGETCRVRNPWSSRASVIGVSDGKTCLLDGEILEFSTERGGRYRIMPEDAEIDDRELAPPSFERGGDKVNWFGGKRAPRF